MNVLYLCRYILVHFCKFSQIYNVYSDARSLSTFISNYVCINVKGGNGIIPWRCGLMVASLLVEHVGCEIESRWGIGW
jgi:hypothetical protein